ncbi:MAG: PHP domain-containing protein, partial [Anaerolineae bacterium]|nr:PHP domain-containing protein [Anaerolineae bacterium]
MKTPFTHLHTHSHYSLLDGLSKIEDLVANAKADGQTALAVTDHGNMYGAIEFYLACKKAEIKPIIGVEAYVANRTRFDKEPSVDNKRYHLILLAKNLVGYKNLLKLVSLSHIEGFYYKPRVDKELLAEYSEGLVCLSGCYGGELARALRNKDRERALGVIAEHQAIFGRDNYFLEIQNHPNIEGHEEVMKEIITLGQRLKIPVVATGDSHYTHQDDKKAHETLLSVQSHNDSREKKFSFGVD